jgi:hypothetical protein
MGRERGEERGGGKGERKREKKEIETEREGRREGGGEESVHVSVCSSYYLVHVCILSLLPPSLPSSLFHIHPYPHIPW